MVNGRKQSNNSRQLTTLHRRHAGEAWVHQVHQVAAVGVEVLSKVTGVVKVTSRVSRVDPSSSPVLHVARRPAAGRGVRALLLLLLLLRRLVDCGQLGLLVLGSGTSLTFAPRHSGLLLEMSGEMGQNCSVFYEALCNQI